MTATPRKKASPAPKRPTTPQQWKKATAEPVELPSGNYMRVRRMGMQALIATGKVPNSLLGIVQSAIDKGTGMEGVDAKMEEMINDQAKLKEMADFMDNLVVLVSLEPKVHPSPQDEADRRDDTLYADELDTEDKSFIFALVTGGTSSLEKFREESQANVAALSGRSNVELPAVGVATTD